MDSDKKPMAIEDHINLFKTKIVKILENEFEIKMKEIPDLLNTRAKQLNDSKLIFQEYVCLVAHIRTGKNIEYITDRLREDIMDDCEFEARCPHIFSKEMIITEDYQICYSCAEREDASAMLWSGG